MNRYDTFISSGQAALRLQLALEGYRDPEEEKEHRTSYAAYLKKRRRPAAAELVRRGCMEYLRRLVMDGVVHPEDVEVLLREAAADGQPGMWLHLLVLREELSCLLSEDNAPSEKSAKEPGSKFTEWGQQMGTAEDCIRRCRSTLWFYFPCLSGALALLEPKSSDHCTSIGTDGRYLYYHPAWVEKYQKECPGQVARLYLHTLLHCIWLHVWDIEPSDAAGSKQADEQIENIILREMQRNPALASRLGASHLSGPAMHGQMDDHRFWGKRQTVGASCRGDRSRWEKAAASASDAAGMSAGSAAGGSGYGLLPGREVLHLDHLEKSRSDYRRFLSAFSVWQEMQEMDPENFDYIYYNLGMELYDRTPLIEALEYREGHRLEQLVIAIDTSGSVKDETVRRFLEETYAILDEKENFFDHMEVWVLQCDLVIEHEQKITCRRDWELYVEQLQIIGRAGTDFRPVFQWIEQKQQDGELMNLKGLLYFTDGDGIFPREAPSYQTAFLHLNQDEGFSYAPEWAQVLSVEYFR